METKLSSSDNISAVGTILAVLLAAYAAIVAQRSARAAIDLVKVESGRDARR